MQAIINLKSSKQLTYCAQPNWNWQLQMLAEAGCTVPFVDSTDSSCENSTQGEAALAAYVDWYTASSDCIMPCSYFKPRLEMQETRFVGQGSQINFLLLGWPLFPCQNPPKIFILPNHIQGLSAKTWHAEFFNSKETF